MAFRLPHWAAGKVALWHPAFPSLGIAENEMGTDLDDLAELFAWINQGELVEAHNAFFERGVWTNICVRKFGWPRIAHLQWRCSAAKAAAHSLPRALEDAGEVVEAEIEKDMEGSAVMKKMMKPRKPTKADKIAWGRQHAPCGACDGRGRVGSLKKDGTPTKLGMKCPTCAGLAFDRKVAVPPMPLLYHESRELLERLFVYCGVDVLAEESLSETLPPLSEVETEMYLLDQAVNQRGFELDAEAIDVALGLIDDEFVDLNAELKTLTGGVVERATQRDRMIDWFEGQGLVLENTRAATIDETLKTELAPHVRRGLELMKALGKSSTAKYVAMANWKCPDNRAHGGMLFHGASTGRWSGAGIQPHNFPRGKVKDQIGLWELLKTRDRARILADAPRDKKDRPLYTTVLDALSSALRGVLVAAPGKQLYVADYAAIEARVLLWLAEDDAALDVFRRGDDIYCEMASSIYGRPIVGNPDNQPPERALGKVAVLGLGYQMGWKKFVATCLTMAGIVISEELSMQVVDAYRAKFWRVKQMWSATERAAIRAVLTKQRVRCGRVWWFVEGDFLYCELPSGRRLGYPSPEIHDRLMPWGDMKPCLTYMGTSAYSRKWQRQNSYGGLLVENITQAVARDLMAEAMLRCEWSGTYKPILSVHDELIAEAAIGAGSVDDFESLMAECPVWAAGCPVEAEGWSGPRYRK